MPESLVLINHLLSAALDDVLTEGGGLTGEEFGFYSLLRRFGPVTATQVTAVDARPAVAAARSR
jgi:hypothetical protein